MSQNEYAKDVGELISSYPVRRRVRNLLRDTTVFFLSLSKRIDRTNNWLRFPYYHHVFDDERKGFVRHLDYLKNYGDFISLENAASLLESKTLIHGRYFCLTVDDGFKNCHTNIMPILVEKKSLQVFLFRLCLWGNQGKPAVMFTSSFLRTRALTHFLFNLWIGMKSEVCPKVE